MSNTPSPQIGLTSINSSSFSIQEPSADALLECFEIFDTNKNGQIPEVIFRKIMAGKLKEEIIATNTNKMYLSTKSGLPNIQKMNQLAH